MENTAYREAQEEVSLSVNLIEQFHIYSNPNRDERKHTMSIVFIATARVQSQAADDAKMYDFLIF